MTPVRGGSPSEKLNSDLFISVADVAEGADVKPVFGSFLVLAGPAFDLMVVALIKLWHPNCSMS